jgi:hypothetical protein
MGRKRKVLFAVLALSILAGGLFTDLRFSDEINHFWFASDWYETGKRPAYLSLVDTREEFGHYKYRTMAPLWHFGLVLIWKVCAGASKAAAQVYHTGFYALLIIGTYLLAREMYGQEAGWYAAVIAATIPMFVAFGVMFLMDMPIAALVPFGLYFIVKKRYFWAGVLMGLMFLTKRNAYFLFPTFFIFTLGGKSLPIISRLKNGLIFCALILAVTLPDFVYRYRNLRGLAIPGDRGQVVQYVGTQIKNNLFSMWRGARKASFPRPATTFQDSQTPSPTTEQINFLPSDIRKPSNIPKYLGLSLILLLAAYLFGIRRFYEKQDFLLLLPIIVYFPLYILFFKGWWGLRYLAPVLPLVAILASKPFAAAKQKRLGYMAIALCLIQFAAVWGFVISERRITPEEKAAFGYIKSEIPTHSRLLTAEPFLISYYTGRRALWAVLFDRPDFIELFWVAAGSRKKEILDKHIITHLLIYKARVYPDQRVRHLGGYPKSFVHKLPAVDFMEKAFENDSIVIWEVKRE